MTQTREETRPFWVRPLPWRYRGGLMFLALLLLFASCSDQVSGRLTAVSLEGVVSPAIERVELLEFGRWGLPRRSNPSSYDPAGAQYLVLTGSGFTEEHVVWLGGQVVFEDRIALNETGTEIVLYSPATEPGAVLDVGVGQVDPWGDDVLQRTVLPQAYPTSGLSSGAVATVGVIIAILALLGTPLFIVLAAITCLGLYLQAELDPKYGFLTSHDPDSIFPKPGKGNNVYISWLTQGMRSNPLFMAIPLFTFAGTLLSESQSPTRIINLCRAFIGWLPGGLALVTLLTCCFLTAFTGASGITIVALGGLLFPLLLREKYPERFSLGLLTTGGSLGLLFPPSLPVIVYGVITRLDVKRLFQACLVPGLLLVFVLFVTCYVVAIAQKVPRHSPRIGEMKSALRAAVWELFLPVLVAGGIWVGVFTPAEASAVAALYILITTVVVYRDLRLRDLPRIVRRSAVLVGAILLIIGMAMGFSDWLGLVRVPQKILAAMQEHVDNRLAFLLMLNGFLLLVGCLMDIFSATLVVVPLIAPIALEFGVDPYHLAAIFLVNLEIGYSTPPVGINLFIASLRFQRPIFALYRASLLFIAVLMVALVLITYVPAFSLGLFSELPEVRLPETSLTVTQGEENLITPEHLSLGEWTLGKAEESVATTERDMIASEERNRVTWKELQDAYDETERSLKKASNSTEQAGLLQELERIEASREVLLPARQALEEARQRVKDLQRLSSTLRWRSRLDGSEGLGEAFDTLDLSPGQHLLTATAIDGRGHVAQASISVTVEPAPEEEGEEEWGEEEWGEDGGS